MNEKNSTNKHCGKSCKHYQESSYTCNSSDPYQKLDYCGYYRKFNFKSLVLILSLLLVLPMVMSVQCNGTGNIINSTTISNGCTLDSSGTYVMSGEVLYINSTNLGKAIAFQAANSTLDCNGSILIGNRSSGELYGIYVNSPNNTFKNCIFYNYSFPIRTDSSSAGLNVVNCTFYIFINAVSFFGANISLINSTFNYDGDFNDYVRISSNRNNYIYGNVFNGNAFGSGTFERLIKVSGYTYNLTIINNVFNHFDYAIDSQSGSNYSFIYNNTFNNGLSGYVFVNSSNDFLSHNYFSNLSSFSIASGTPSLVNVFLNISNNVFNNSQLITINNVTNLMINNNFQYGYRNSSLYSIGIYRTSRNISLFNNVFLNFGYYIFQTGAGASSRGNIIIYNNTFYNESRDVLNPYGHTSQIIDLYDFNEVGDIINISNNVFNRTSKAIYYRNGSVSFYIENNIFDDLSGNIDGYNGGIVLSHVSNVKIYNNDFTRIGCFGILGFNLSNSNITDNYFSFNHQYNINEFTNCHLEPIVAISLPELWKTWTTFAQSSDSDNLTTLMQYQKSSNINIYNNNFTNLPVFLKTQGIQSLSFNFTDYWLRSFQSPTYLVDKTDLYINNFYENVTTISNWTTTSPQFDYVNIDDTIGEGFRGFTFYYTGSYKTFFKIYKSYFYFRNVNLSQTYDIIFFNQSNALIYYSNNSASICNGDCNITLNPLEYAYVLDNFNLTEGVSRQYSPIWFSSSSTDGYYSYKTIPINSNLTNGVNVTTVLSTGGRICGDVLSADYKNSTGATIKTYTNYLNWSCSGSTITFTDLYIPTEDVNITLNYIRTGSPYVPSGTITGASGTITGNATIETPLIKTGNFTLDNIQDYINNFLNKTISDFKTKDSDDWSTTTVLAVVLGTFVIIGFAGDILFRRRG